MRIGARDVRVRYGNRDALAGVSCDLKAGEMVGLIGPNGAGKTTLIRALAGLVKPSAGEIKYDGRGLHQIGRADLARRLAYLAQGGAADWPLSVEAIVGLGRLPHRRPFSPPSAADAVAIERALASAELTGMRDRTLRQLSGGEQARVLLARALAVEAEWLLADEPVAALDPLHQLRTMSLLRAEAGRGAGVVAVLHDLTLAVRFCDRLIVLAHGRILADGAPSALTEDVIAEAYGVTALHGVHEGEAFVLPWAAKA